MARIRCIQYYSSHRAYFFAHSSPPMCILRSNQKISWNGILWEAWLFDYEKKGLDISSAACYINYVVCCRNTTDWINLYRGVDIPSPMWYYKVWWEIRKCPWMITEKCTKSAAWKRMPLWRLKVSWASLHGVRMLKNTLTSGLSKIIMKKPLDKPWFIWYNINIMQFHHKDISTNRKSPKDIGRVG